MNLEILNEFKEWTTKQQTDSSANLDLLNKSLKKDDSIQNKKEKPIFRMKTRSCRKQKNTFKKLKVSQKKIKKTVLNDKNSLPVRTVSNDSSSLKDKSDLVDLEIDIIDTYSTSLNSLIESSNLKKFIEFELLEYISEMKKKLKESKNISKYEVIGVMKGIMKHITKFLIV